MIQCNTDIFSRFRRNFSLDVGESFHLANSDDVMNRK